MNTQSVLLEELGPRGKRRVQIGTAISLTLVAAFVVWAIVKLDDQGQLEAEKWTDLFQGRIPRFLYEGVLFTLKAAIVSIVIAMVTGFGLALMRLSNSRLLRSVTIAWVELFRALPLLLLIIGVFALDAEVSPPGDAYLGPFWSVVVALVLYNSAVLSEVFRAGVLSLDKGQTEAAKSVGMSYWQAMFLVILPQAVRRMVPTLVAQMATQTKDVSLGFVIGYEEFVRRGAGLSNFRNTESGNLQAYVLVAVVYFFIIYAIAKVAEWIESRQGRSSKAAPIDPAGPSAIADPSLSDAII